VRITRATESEFTPGRWLCDLGCGHQQWVPSEGAPTETTCSRCPRDERQEARAAAVNSGSGQGETAETAAFKERWLVELHCRVCRAKFELERWGMHVSLQQSAPFTRLVLLAVQEVCPVCKSLRSVPEPTESSP
jgi:hypothetical protein